MKHISWIGLAALFFLTACTGGSPPLAEPATATAPPVVTPSPSATIVWFPPTATSTLAPTSAASPTPDLLPVKGELILEDDFSDETAWQTQQTASGSVAYGNQTLSLAISTGKTSLMSFRSGPALADFYLEITANASLCRGSDNYGLLLRAASDRDFYRWIITCDGNMRLERLRDGLPAVMQDWTPRVAPPDADRLSVWFSGGEMKFYIDGLLQFSLHDPVFTSGSLGVFARSSGENALTVNFSDLQVYRTSAPQREPVGTPVSVPTVRPTP